MTAVAKAAPAATPEREYDLVLLTTRISADIGLDPVKPLTSDQLMTMLGRAFMMGANVALNTAEGHRVCRICGVWSCEECEPGDAPEGGGPVAWVAHDLCAVCLPTSLSAWARPCDV